MAAHARPTAVGLFPVFIAFLVGGCSGGSNGPAPSIPVADQSVASSSAASSTAATASEDDSRRAHSILNELTEQRTIGSTIDPRNGDLNPYGLDIARFSFGKISFGDLVVCNFNDAANVQGTGTTIISLHPVPGSKPTHIAQSATLLGCDALALTPFNDSSNAAFAANDNPIVNAQGRILTTLPQFRWSHPFGEAFGISRRTGFPVFYVSQAGDGSIVRVSLDSTRRFMFEKIITGFAVNGGAPGSILGPSGLQYSFRKDTLYVVDGANNTLTSIDDVSFVSSNGLHVNPSGQTFSGPSAKRAKLLFKGAPLNGPISSALLPNGNLVLGNTLDPNGINLMVEFSSRGKLLARKNVDTGAAGAIFGIVATGHEYGETKLYFNDDNLNAVQVLER